MAAAVLTIDINARLASLEQAVAKIPGIFSAGSGKVESAVKNLNKTVLDFSKTALVAFGVPIGAGELIAFVGTLKDKALESEHALNQLNAVIKATGQSAGLSKQDLGGLTEELTGKTIFDDDQIRAAETALLRFRTVQGDVFRDAIRLAPDVAAALGKDLPEAAIALGKALTDPEGGMKALKAAGLALSDQQKDLAARLIESGDKAGAQRIVLDELTKSVGGAAEADNSGLYGASKRLTRSWDDLLKTTGRKLFADNTKGIEETTGALERLNKLATEMKLNLSDLSSKPFAFAGAAVDVVKRILNIGEPPPRREVSGRISGVNDADAAAADAAREARIKQREDQAYNDQQSALKRLADGAASYYRGEFDVLKTSLDAKQSALDFGYQRNLISSASYYSDERKLANDNLQATGRYIREQQDAQEALLKAPSTTRDQRYEIEQKLFALSGQNDAARAERTKRLQVLDQQELLAAEKLSDQYASLNIQLLEITGNTVGAAAASFALAHKEDFRRTNTELGSTDPVARARAAEASANLSALNAETVRQAELTKATRDYTAVLDLLNLASNRLSVDQAAGNITELDALNKRSELNRAMLPLLQAQADAAERLAATSKDPAVLIAAIRLKEEVYAISQQTDLLADKFRGTLTDSFTSALDKFAQGGTKLSDIIKGLEQDLIRGIGHTASQNISETLFKKGGLLGDLPGGLSQLFGGGSKGGVGGANTADAALSVLGGTTTGANAALAQFTAALLQATAASAGKSLGGWTSGFDLPTGGDTPAGWVSGFDLPGAANGMDDWKGGPLWVGEHGKELLNLPKGSQVVSNGKATNMRGGDTYHIYNQIMPGATRKSADQASASFMVRLAGAKKRTL